MHYLWAVIIGLVVGALAKIIRPGISDCFWWVGNSAVTAAGVPVFELPVICYVKPITGDIPVHAFSPALLSLILPVGALWGAASLAASL